MMRVVTFVAGAVIGVALTLKGVALATEQPRPRNVGGMLLSALALALAVASIAGIAASLG